MPRVCRYKHQSSHRFFLANSNDDPDTKGTDPSLSMTVPDPDFHDFDKDRTEKSFGDNQVWAAYDDDDGMPRYYAMIHSVISTKPFRMQISWLNSKNNRELGPLNWIGSGFYKTSGVFWIGKHEVSESLNSFSHKVKWAKGTRGTVQIYPRRGDVWALYRNWSPDWNELTPDEVIHKYDMVEVLEDYDEERGVTVLLLLKLLVSRQCFAGILTPVKPRQFQERSCFGFLTRMKKWGRMLKRLRIHLGIKKSAEEQLVEDGEIKGKNVVKDAAKDVAEVRRDKGKETKMDANSQQAQSASYPPQPPASGAPAPPAPTPFHHLLQQQQQQLQMFWSYQRQEIEQVNDFKNHQLPLARIKKIMKADEEFA
ncbi:hypothetical protein GH714_024460 [Hevea brasiliensis]|uniref:DUF3444 domain-containing protein n=1 Tax=Hevea brasiliensis TaxID=3981 RepID=A0A6A6MGF0_HEVBR|nr:hypothetical protein GH714_024460 [Hevea brasiliensis]